ncbi:MAG: alanine--tRNA ligase, partial [Candidatus Natronoplasma sp.]
MFEEEYKLDFFKENGFIRKECPSCGGHFWTVNEEQRFCQDAPCVEFGFIGDPPASRELSIPEMRDFFVDFFSERGHTPLDRYPVVARWRDDVFLVHASIYDFQPHVTSGQVEPPANPLVISQPSIRLPDIDEVGLTGKHQTGFEMMGHHAFNSKDNYVYWKEETVGYCHQMLNEMGIPDEMITYKEKPWIGGGNAGPSLEVLVEGLEVATLVFMNMRMDPEGEVELDGDKYSPLDLNVVDTGYGLERLSWITDGAPTIYDSVYPDVVAEICEKIGIEHPLDDEEYREIIEEYTRLAGGMEKDFTDEGLVDELMKRLSSLGIERDRDELVSHLSDMKSVFIIADHSRTIAFMLADGVVPSNVEEGYLARMVIRRTLRQINNYGGAVKLHDIVEQQMKKFSDVIDLDKKDHVMDMLDSEIEKYEETLERGKRLVERELEKKKGGKLSLDMLMDFYDTHGIHPTIVEELSEQFDVEVDIPDNFNQILASRHEGPEKEEKKEVMKERDLPGTELLYYEEPNRSEFEAEVVYSEEDEVVLDRTLFYPEGGGQLTDKGVLKVDGESYEVHHVRKEGDVVIHEIDGKIPEDGNVVGKVDWDRRMTLTRHHTATHVIISAAREVLGEHIWQRGAQKSVESARLDLSHYKRISRDEIKRIEEIANDMVLSGIPVVKEELTRDEAEERYGFKLYQGGVPTSDVIRVVHISDVEDYDAQACGGTHVDNTSEIGMIKIINTQRIQDGVERLTYTAGTSTLGWVQEQEDLMIESAEKFKVIPEKLPETAERFFKEWKERGKELEEMKKYKSIAVAEELLPGEVID